MGRLATSRPYFLRDEVARTSASDASRERSTCFTCRNVGQRVNFWPKKNMIDVSKFSCASHAIITKEESNSIKTFTSAIP